MSTPITFTCVLCFNPGELCYCINPPLAEPYFTPQYHDEPEDIAYGSPSSSNALEYGNDGLEFGTSFPDPQAPDFMSELPWAGPQTDLGSPQPPHQQPTLNPTPVPQHANTGYQPRKPRARRATTSDAVFQCSNCEERFTESRNKWRHEKQQVCTPDTWNKSKSHCPTCSQKFTRPDNMARHCAKSHKRCVTCGEIFQDGDEVMRHRVEVHTVVSKGRRKIVVK
ncbi:hypothetical protein P280DRAFT_519790 [Massarina eburnea CBS 473.64]|uniref:C2H2-type domain-containing protein n=1 Tax=Massarina eburnea CBS 473.64 TaxID=1395130 RepID=A0A6A6RUD8_9PLEO|nr:hypothetical protein P280DRAFT_519790 [Massarina eburnea CBS 473.64]